MTPKELYELLDKAGLDYEDIIDELVQREITWFNELEYADRQQYLKDFFLNGLKGVSKWSDEAILRKCVDIGMFLTEE